jgi:hypothetical protein
VFQGSGAKQAVLAENWHYSRAELRRGKTARPGQHGAQFLQRLPHQVHGARSPRSPKVQHQEAFPDGGGIHRDCT